MDIYIYFTFVQGQTPVTPPTLANTKENWMEEGTDHVISAEKSVKYVPLELNTCHFRHFRAKVCVALMGPVLNDSVSLTSSLFAVEGGF